MCRPLVAIVGLALLGPAEALAQAGWYSSLSGGAAFLSDADLEEAGITGEATFDTGFGIVGALGRSWPGLALGTLRTELEVGYRLNDVDEISAMGVTVSAGDADVSALSGMANVAFDLATGTGIRPYVLAGVGVAHLSLDSDDLGIDESDTVLAYQAGVGVGFDITTSSTLFGGYRFFGTADPEFDGTEAEYNSHNVEAGIRMNF